MSIKHFFCDEIYSKILSDDIKGLDKATIEVANRFKDYKIEDTASVRNGQQVPFEPTDNWTNRLDERTMYNSILQGISDFIIKSCYDFKNFTMQNMWYNISPKGSYNLEHIHGNCDYSGIYYVHTIKGHPNVHFKNPNLVANMRNRPLKTALYGSLHTGHNEIYFEPKPCMLTIFPSYIPHRVDENKMDETRISLAFNFNVS